MTEFAFADRQVQARAGQTFTILHFRGPEGRQVSLAMDGEVDPDFSHRCRIFYEPKARSEAGPPLDAGERQPRAATPRRHEALPAHAPVTAHAPDMDHNLGSMSLSDPRVITALLEGEFRRLVGLSD